MKIILLLNIFIHQEEPVATKKQTNLIKRNTTTDENTACQFNNSENEV